LRNDHSRRRGPGPQLTFEIPFGMPDELLPILELETASADF
jgi:hypothetical protein